MEKLYKGMSQVPGRTEWDGVIFHHATQNSVHFKTDELFPSGIFPLICTDRDWLWSLSRMMDGGGRGCGSIFDQCFQNRVQGVSEISFTH